MIEFSSSPGLDLKGWVPHEMKEKELLSFFSDFAFFFSIPWFWVYINRDDDDPLHSNDISGIGTDFHNCQ